MKRTIKILLSLLTGITLTAADGRDLFGGWRSVHGQATGFFHPQQVDGVWWLVTPDGNGFFSKGVNHISYKADHSPALGFSPYARLTAEKYGSPGAWAEVTALRLRTWGFNTVGAWSSRETFKQRMPYTLILNLAASAGANWQEGRVADVFSPKFAEGIRRQAQRLCAPLANDPYLLGYFADNELRWGKDWRSDKSLFEECFALPSDAAGRKAALRVLRSQFESVEAFNKEWGMQISDFADLDDRYSLPASSEAAKATQKTFLREYARVYFKTCREAIQAVDSNHLILGCRFAGYAPDEVIQAIAEYVDVVSFNNYGFTPPARQLERLYRTTGKPIMLTEFSFKAQDSGLPNTRGAGKPVPTQKDRAEHFDSYVTALAEMPFMVGFHWFEYCDEPAEGRFDGENSNYGLVNIKDEPWQILVERMTEVNERIEQVHGRAR